MNLPFWPCFVLASLIAVLAQIATMKKAENRGPFGDPALVVLSFVWWALPLGMLLAKLGSH